MNRPMLTVLALLGLVAGAWLYLSGSSAQDATLDPEADAAAAEEAQPALIGSGDPGLRTPPPRTPAESGEPAQPPTRPAKRSAYSVRGTVTGIPSADADQVRITIRPIDQGSYGPDDDRHVLGTLQADLQFSIDVDTLLVDAGEAALLQIVVDHPRSLAAEIRVDVSARATSATWEVKVALLPAAVVWGFVRDVDDRPVAKAPVAAYAMDGTHPRLGSVLPIPALHSVKTDHTGRYQLRVPGDGSFLVVSFLAPRRPASTTVRLTEGATTHAPPLILRRGVSLTGMASFAGQRLPGASVGARSTLPVGIPLSLGDSYVNWQAGRVVYAERTTRCDANGTFRFEGMLPGDWSLGIFSASISGYDYTSDHMLRASNQVVTVPASEVELTFLGATQRVGVDGLSQTDTHFSVRVNDRGASVVTSVRRGAQARLLLPPDVELEFVVTARGYLPTTRTVHTAPAGGERSLRVTLVRAPR